ncbi:MAG TPA: adenylate kinase [Kiritimatiellae bacterium]|nr:adenylate kinase [Kiritimatiellia bacterium]
MKAIILLGAPGAGKGTIAEELAKRGGYEHVSTGDMLRVEVREGTQLGRAARSYMEKGELVPDQLIIEIIGKRLASARADTCLVFDGFPRNVAQAEALEREVVGHGGKVSHVFLLEVPERVLVDRISGRWVCRKCGAVYHVRNLPPKQPGICDVCGGELYQRPDDNEQTVINRLKVYRQNTAPLISYYESKGLLRRVPAAGTPEATVGTIMACLGEDGCCDRD